MNVSKWSKEYKKFLINELFPLLGIPQNKNVIDVGNESLFLEIIVKQENVTSNLLTSLS